MTQPQFAARLGLASKGQISDLENGRITPSPKVALKLQELSGGDLAAAGLNAEVAAIIEAAGQAPSGATPVVVAGGRPSPTTDTLDRQARPPPFLIRSNSNPCSTPSILADAAWRRRRLSRLARDRERSPAAVN